MGVEVEEKERTVTTGFWFWKKEKKETYYQLTTGNEKFDWTQGGTDEYGAAVYDILASEDVTYNIVYTTGEMQKGKLITNYKGGWFKNNTIYVDPRGSGKDPSSVILMHEMIGHGHPVGGPYSLSGFNSYEVGNALRVTNHYRTKLGIYGQRKGDHGAFKGDRRLHNYNNNLMFRLWLDRVIMNSLKN